MMINRWFNLCSDNPLFWGLKRGGCSIVVVIVVMHRGDCSIVVNSSNGYTVYLCVEKTGAKPTHGSHFWRFMFGKKRSIVYIYIRLYIPLLLRHSFDLLCDGFLAPLVPLGVLSSGLEMEDALQEIQKAVEAGEVWASTVWASVYYSF